MLGVSRGFVYDHADELGAVRLGSGPKARLRFDVAGAIERLRGLRACDESRESMQPEPARASRRRREANGTGVELLPIRPRPRVRGAA